MTKLQVETCGGVLLQKRSPEREVAAQAALLECAGAFSPRVESTCRGTVILDLAGTAKLFGSPETTACKITVSARQIGLHLRIAIAANPDAAMYAARGFAGITVIPVGDEAKVLAPLRVGILPASPALLEVLDSWGIRTFNAVAALPSIALTEPLGEQRLDLRKHAPG